MTFAVADKQMQRIVLSAITDDGQRLAAETVERLFQVPGSATGTDRPARLLRQIVVGEAEELPAGLLRLGPFRRPRLAFVIKPAGVSLMEPGIG